MLTRNAVPERDSVEISRVPVPLRDSVPALSNQPKMNTAREEKDNGRNSEIGTVSHQT
jgi:hypothetical protein